jgi:aminomethyltransferase
MVTNNVRDLPANHGVYAFLLNAQGRIQGDLYAFNLGERIVLELDRAQAARLIGLLDHYIVMDDVVLEDVSGRLSGVAVQGPRSKVVLEAAGIPVAEMDLLQTAGLIWQGVEITLVRAEEWKGEAYEIWLAPERLAGLMEALGRAGAASVGEGALRLYRMAAGIPVFGEDIRERDLPQETGQERALHFAKGCYVGQEIVERIRSRGQVHRVFSGFELTAEAAAGDKIEAEGKEVGEITSTATFSGPERERRIGLGYLRREAFGKALTVHGAVVQRHELPFQELLQP